jgi:hypothetical protein
MMEIDPKYVSVIIKRWLNFTNNTEAEVIRSGKIIKQKVF